MVEIIEKKKFGQLSRGRRSTMPRTAPSRISRGEMANPRAADGDLRISG